MIPTSRGLKPRKHSKTFTGCWTCRARKVKCDEKRPACLQCVSKRLSCAGYGLRLHWLTPEQGIATSDQDTQCQVRSQRSRIPFESCQHALDEDQLDRILTSIDNIEPELTANSSGPQDTYIVHNFGVFNIYPTASGLSTSGGTPTDPPFFGNPTLDDTLSSPLSGCFHSTVNSSHSGPVYPFAPDFLDSLDPCWYPTNNETTARNASIAPALPEISTEWGIHRGREVSDDHEENNYSQRNVLRVNSRQFRWQGPSGTIIYNPSPAYLSPLEQFLMNHYMHRVVRLFCIIDNMKSPWQKIHLKRTLQSTGQMNIEGKSSQIQDALRNALLSISAFTLSNDSRSRGHHEEAIRWANEAMILRGKTFKLLKDSVERGFTSEASPKYKDYLATMLSMISINVMSGDTSTCAVHLDGAFYFMKTVRSWKVNYSAKARSLHRIYFYLRAIYESTAMRDPEDIPCGPSSLRLAIPELSQSRSEELTYNANESSAAFASELETRMSTYECIYGVPHYLLVLLKRTTHLIVSLTATREKNGLATIPDELADECDKLETAIMDWPLDLELSRCLIDDVSPSSKIIHRTARAFHHALVIYFAQHVRLVSYRYLRSHIQCVLECIEAIEKIKAESDCFAAPLYWPAFIAASEAFDQQVQSRFRAWYEQVEMYGIAAVRTGTRVLTQVWKNGPGTGNQITSQWQIEVKRTSSILMLS